MCVGIRKHFQTFDIQSEAIEIGPDEQSQQGESRQAVNKDLTAANKVLFLCSKAAELQGSPEPESVRFKESDSEQTHQCQVLLSQQC